MVRVRAPAKLNLGLSILARRPDGYHEIDTVFVPLRLCDDLYLERARAPGITLECAHEQVPAGDDNLAVRAAAAAQAALGEPGGLSLRLLKRIPVAAGLGGGSSDAAAAILGAEALAGRRLEPAARLELACGLGADVPFFLDPRPMRGQGVGERLTPVAQVPERWWVLAILPFPVSTRDAYEAASGELTLPRQGSSIAALLGSQGVVPAPHNDLEAVTARCHPEIGQSREALREAGARMTGMSGSGPTVYGEFRDRAAAEHGARVVRLPEGAEAVVTSSPGSDDTSFREPSRAIYER